jgi:hypothetical protein
MTSVPPGPADQVDQQWQSSDAANLSFGGMRSVPCIAETVQWNLARMPERRYLDALIQYFVCELDW